MVILSLLPLIVNRVFKKTLNDFRAFVQSFYIYSRRSQHSLIYYVTPCRIYANAKSADPLLRQFPPFVITATVIRSTTRKRPTSYRPIQCRALWFGCFTTKKDSSTALGMTYCACSVISTEARQRAAEKSFIILNSEF